MDAGFLEALERSEYRRQRNLYRRRKQFRRQIILVVLTIVLVAVLTISYHAILSTAASETKEVSFKYYTSIEVAYGDSLWSIAEAYISDEYDSVNDYIKEVKAINHMDEDAIVAGQSLIIPYFSTEFK